MTANSTPAVVQNGSFLTLHYRLAGPQGDVINTFNDKPATLSLGAGELSPAVEQRLLGLSEGERVSFDLLAGEAFGEGRGAAAGGHRLRPAGAHGPRQAPPPGLRRDR